MIARPKMSQNERKTTEIRGFKKLEMSHPFPAQVGANECEPEVRQVNEPKKNPNRLKTLHLTWDVPGADDIKAGFHWLEMADDIRNMAAGDRLDARVNATILVINVGLHINILAKDACEAVVARTEASLRAGKGCENPNFKGSSLGRFPLVSAHS